MDDKGAPQESVRVWIEDGIFYSLMENEISVKTIKEVMAKSSTLLIQKQIKLIPWIAILGKSSENHIKFGVNDFTNSKLMSFASILDHFSSISIVGAGKKTEKLLSFASSLFLSNRARFFDTLSEAQAALKSSLPPDESITEQRRI